LIISRNSHELVTLLVGKGTNVKKFVLHKDFACYYSPVFKAAFNGNFIEGQTQEYHLEDVSEETAQFLVQWIYHQTLTIAQLDNGGAYIRKEWRDLVHLWVLADKLLIPRLQNVVLRYLYQVMIRIKTTPFSIIPYVYEHTTSNSPLRRFVVDYCASKLKPEKLQKFPQDFPSEMVTDLAIVWANMIPMTKRKVLLKPKNVANYDVPEN